MAVRQCNPNAPGQKWSLNPMEDLTWNVSSFMTLKGTDFCLTAPSPFSDEVASVRILPCGKRHCSQLWFVHAYTQKYAVPREPPLPPPPSGSPAALDPSALGRAFPQPACRRPKPILCPPPCISSNCIWLCRPTPW